MTKTSVGWQGSYWHFSSSGFNVGQKSNDFSLCGVVSYCTWRNLKRKKTTRPILSHQLVISAHIIIGNITPFAQGIILE